MSHKEVTMEDLDRFIKENPEMWAQLNAHDYFMPPSFQKYVYKRMKELVKNYTKDIKHKG